MYPHSAFHSFRHFHCPLGTGDTAANNTEVAASFVEIVALQVVMKRVLLA